jgi:prepilin-type processing-associated H-X9-DG protein
MSPSHIRIDGRHRRAVTIVELLTVVGVIVLLAGILLAALAAVRGTGKLADSQNRLRQVAIWMQAYSTDNREFIVPSRFDYSGNSYPGKVRSNDPCVGDQFQGSWTDILWTVNEVAFFPEAEADAPGHDYRFDSPDTCLYQVVPDYDNNPFRSASTNSRSVGGGSGPLPFGTGAREQGEPGYFAANDFFDSTQNGWWVTGQIKAPDQALYAIDSFAGETISPGPDPYDLTVPAGDPSSTLEVDLRYNGQCLVLFLDGHVTPEGPWQDLDDLERNRRIRVRNLNQPPTSGP